MKLFGHSKNRFGGGGVALLAGSLALAMILSGTGDARSENASEGAGSIPAIVTGKVLVPKRVRLITGFKQHGLA